MRDILAHKASYGRLDADGFKKAIRANRLPECDNNWLARLARVCALQNFFADDREFALSALEVANRKLPKKTGHQRFFKLEVELLMEAGHFQSARERILENDNLAKQFHGYLLTDLKNPRTVSPENKLDEWLKSFNRAVQAYGLRPVELTGNSAKLFDRLSARPVLGPILAEQPLVTVVMTTYRPEPKALRTSIRSIIQQSWQNWELLIVDDASPDGYSEVLEEAQALDQRIRLVRLEDNGGTYRARNVGLKYARGEFFTCQDDDDWSHPDRLLTQVSILSKNPELPATQAYALKVTEDMVFQRVGYNPFADSAPTLFMRTNIVRSVGGYLPARKAADNELRHRISAYTGREVQTDMEPLMLMRILPDSLSRSDFRAGWAHPARRAFSSAYSFWHRTATKADLVLSPGGPSPVPIPRRFQIEEPPPFELDVVFAGDWRQSDGPQNSMLNEIAALRMQGYRVGILHLEAARMMSKVAKPINDAVQKLVNDGDVVQVLPDDVGTVDLLILRYPPILQFAPYYPVRFSSKRLLIVANQVPSESDNTDIRYIPKYCSDVAERLFGLRGLWAPQGPIARRSLEGLLPDSDISTFDVVGILDLDAWRADRSNFRGSRPVIGRHSRDNFVKWPSQPRDILAAWPTDGSLDVRIMGGASTALSILGLRRTPSSWVVFEPHDTSVRAFLGSLDFFVYFHHEHWGEAFGRAILEALASGCVAILPPHFEKTFAEGALYAQPQDVERLVQSYYSEPSKYREQVERAWRVVDEKFSYAGYSKRIKELLSISPKDQGLWWV